MNRLKIIGSLAFLSFILSSCGNANNTISGMAPLNPASKNSDRAGSEFTSLSSQNKTSMSGYVISASLGDKTSASLKPTTSGKYKVALTVQGQINTAQK